VELPSPLRLKLGSSGSNGCAAFGCFEMYPESSCKTLHVTCTSVVQHPKFLAECRKRFNVSSKLIKSKQLREGKLQLKVAFFVRDNFHEEAFVVTNLHH